MLKGAPHIGLQSFEGAVAHVATPGDNAEGGVRHDVRGRHGQISISRGKHVGAFIAKIAERADQVEGKLPVVGEASRKPHSRLCGCDPGRAVKRHPNRRFPRRSEMVSEDRKAQGTAGSCC